MRPTVGTVVGLLPGFLAVNSQDLCLPGATDLVGVDTRGGVRLLTWGLEGTSTSPPLITLSRVVRDHRGSVSQDAVLLAMQTDPATLTRLLPPFAVVGGDCTGCTMVADSMGFRQLYHTRPVRGPGAMSTSALLLAQSADLPLDQDALAIQSQLGWQLRDRTLHSGVHKLAAGSTASLDGDGLGWTGPGDTVQQSIPLDEAVKAAASLLRQSLTTLLDEYPDAVLQLTGGQDSRLLLSAVPSSRRGSLRAMTLGAADDPDVVVARTIAARYGLEHEVHPSPGTTGLTPADAWSLVARSARRLDAVADPLALASLTRAEGLFDQGVRISGLGGEVARGFYYLGPVSDGLPVTRQRAERLATWRMLVNEAVEPEMLRPDFRAWAYRFAKNDVYEIVSASGRGWFQATDDLYLRHRMQRWAGVTDTAVATERIIVNPMLDAGFIDTATRLAPVDKANSRFLAALQMELDPELGRLPLEGRPAPVVYANPRPWHAPIRAAAVGHRLVRKVSQRARRDNRPPDGAAALADLVTSYWREHPDVLAPAAALGVVDPAWLDDVLAGRRQPRPSSVAFLTNAVVAMSFAGAQG